MAHPGTLENAGEEPKPFTPDMTLAEILAPVHENFRATGMTAEELGEFIDAEIKAYRAEKRARREQESDPHG